MKSAFTIKSNLNSATMPCYVIIINNQVYDIK